MNVRVMSLALVVLMVSVSLPHSLLWNFGADAGYAADPTFQISYSGSNQLTVAEGGTITISLTITKSGAGAQITNEDLQNFEFKLSTATGGNIQIVQPASGACATGASTSPCSATLVSLKTTESPYTFSARHKSGTPSTQNIMITVTGTTSPTGSNGCCILVSGDQRTYKNAASRTGDLSVKCPEGGNYDGRSCDDQSLQNSICQSFCVSQQSTNGQCVVGFQPNPQNRLFGGICNNNLVCQCGPVDRQAQLRNTKCSDACLTGSTNQFLGYSPTYSTQSMSFPVGTCTSNPQSLLMTVNIASQSGVAGSGVSRQPYQMPGSPGDYQCGPNEYCYCVYYDFGSFSASRTQLPPSIPGTQMANNWTAPDAIQNPPQKQANERRCNYAVNATLKASFGTVAVGDGTTPVAMTQGMKLTQSGTPITIVGSVNRLTDECDGYIYKCRTQQATNCIGDNGYFSTSYTYQNCPANLPEIVHQEGERSETNWARWGSLGATVGLVVAAFFCGGCTVAYIPSAAQGLIPTSSCTNPSTTDQQAIASSANMATWALMQYAQQNNQQNPQTPVGPTAACTTGCASAPANCNPGGVISGTNCPGVQVCCVNGVKIIQAAATADPTIKITGDAAAPTQTAAAGGMSAGSAAGMGAAGIAGSVLASYANACPDFDPPCFRVCGKTYDTKASYAPTCVGPVIGYEEATYKCGMGDCGPYGNKKVQIRIYGPTGQLSIDDTTTTGSDGTFSYTFNAPAADGQFTAVVSVPKGS